MMNTGDMSTALPNRAHQLLKSHWGYDQFRPYQEEAIAAILDGQDTLCVFPAGSGKSLCFQLPSLMMPGCAIVVSPLIALMKDQVDGLKVLDIPAGSLNSMQSPTQQYRTMKTMQEGGYKLLYVAPERFSTKDFMMALEKTDVAFFAIDEAHCISQWGHDFRPAYNRLSMLRERFPDVGIHAFTATATTEVQQDILEALKLRTPKTFVGDFDRPNLFYDIQLRNQPLKQIMAVIERYPGEGGIIYCISRKQVDELTVSLKEKGYKALSYHSGLTEESRRHNQEAFISEEAQIIVATIAFGMGINRPNIRYVIHLGMPKSIEHYQQETGRAGRDGLDAYCLLLYTPGDMLKWNLILSEAELTVSEASQWQTVSKLQEMADFCQARICRHRFLAEYFGQSYLPANYGHCDICLQTGEPDAFEASQTVANAILDCVNQLNDGFGATHILSILRGSQTQKIHQLGHDYLRPYGILKAYSKADVTHWIEQLIQMHLLERDPFFATLRLTPAGRAALEGKQGVSLTAPSKAIKRQTPKHKEASPPEDSLLQRLKQHRRHLAQHHGIHPHLIVPEGSLVQMAQKRPKTLKALGELPGMSAARLEKWGVSFLEVLCNGSS